MRKYDRASKCFRLALDKNPQNSDVRVGLGKLYHSQGKNPQNSDVRVGLGKIYHSQGKVGKALEYHKALQNNDR
ncbi:hypothetical protein BDB00DRAFT_933679 [Zychaea mexicana]|uniref:uncharacterized protein n=1 Tax=Zychaea mexicana TaxID=64656 RepID=UPI0022FEAEE3|nr:uncharacterized protein BDB00DRAFT_933679 [Zychaea mexicana]KAI9484438.1 hypothetical protein BDB00DRAFT_933679 [Zychaea mexicana]